MSKHSPDISNFVKGGKVSVLFDGQFGSTGKGLAAAWVGEHNEIDWCITNASANAGHTTINADGSQTVLFHLPSSFLTARDNGYARIIIDKGAIVDLDVLIKEIEENKVSRDQIFVDPNAAVILPEDAEAEKQRWSSQTKVASTQKGVGSALARKVERSGPNLGQYIKEKRIKVPFSLSPPDINEELRRGAAVMLEVPQGFSLSLSASGFYPYTTSRDCTPQQGLSDAGIHPRFFHKSMSVIRTFPIRVGNITNDKGQQIGFSGQVYPDQREVTWESIGQPEERTTVTKRVRRVFTFSQAQYEAMIRYTMPDVVFLNFCNYTTPERLGDIVSKIDQTHKSTGIASPLMFYGYGPASKDIKEF